MSSERPGSAWWNVPMIRLEDYVALRAQVTALLAWQDWAETRILNLERLARGHSAGVVPRETDSLGGEDDPTLPLEW